MTFNDTSCCKSVSDNYLNFRQAFKKVHEQIPRRSEKANMLWIVGSATPSLIKHLPYLLIMNTLNKSNKMLLLISDLHDLYEDSAKLTSSHELYRRFNIGAIVQFDEIYYTQDYQKSLFRLTRLVNAKQAIEAVHASMPKSTDVESLKASDLMSVLLITNDILHFNASYVFVEEHQLAMYRFIQSLLLETYERTLTILQIPTLPVLIPSSSLESNHLSLNATRAQILHEIARLDTVEQMRIRSYFKAIIDEFLNGKPSWQNTFASELNIADIRDSILLSPFSNEDSPIYIAASFLTDQFHVLRQHWRKNVNKDNQCTGTGKGIDGLQVNQKGFEPPLGGKFAIINWLTKAIVYTLDLDAPAGFFIEDNHLYIANNRLHYISIIDLTTRMEIKRIENPAFNCLHSIQRAEDETILVANTGIDAILQIDSDGETISDWYATEHGYATTPKGEKRIVERDFAHHQYIYPTLHQTTHINSVTVFDSDYFLATLFHQGTLVKIHRSSGRSENLMAGLTCPHAIKRYRCAEASDVAWLLCNTKQNELLFLDGAFQLAQKMFLEDVSWLQDASQLSNGHLIVADANHSRIIEIDPKSNSVIDEFVYSTDWRIYQFNDLSDFRTDFARNKEK